MVVNKKGLKRCGLLLAFSIMLGLSLNVCSDSSALSYGASRFNIGNDVMIFRKLYDNSTNSDVYSYFSHKNQFMISFLSNHDIPSDFTYPHTYIFTGDYDSSTRTCAIPAFHSSYYSDGVSGTSLGSPNRTLYYNKTFNTTFNAFNITSSDSPFSFSSSFDTSSSFWTSYMNSLCHIVGMTYSDSSPSIISPYEPLWNWSSLANIPLVNNRWEYEKSKPFTYQYNNISLNSTRKVDGAVISSNGLKMSSIFNSAPSTFNNLHMEFGLFDDITTDLSDSDWDLHEDVNYLEFKGSIVFDSDFTLNPDSGIYYSWNNYYDPSWSSSTSNSTNLYNINGHDVYSLQYQPHSSSVTNKQCSIDEYHLSSGDNDNRIDFTCVYDPISDGAFVPTINFRYMSNFRLNFGYDAFTSWNHQNFFTTTGDYTFKNFRVVTNHVDIDAGWDATVSTGGGADHNSPGNDGWDSDFEYDWSASLKSLFGFNFLNPFSGIFNLFGDSSSCASIPTIASMIHSEETSVCPWFDSNTRSITTPVVGLASVMLVFGFAVRWLGSSSGNLFEDSGGVDTDNYHFGNKFRRNK